MGPLLVIASIVTVLLLGYLGWALLFPEELA